MQTQKSRIGNLAIALLVMILLWPHLAEAQQPTKVPRIGYVAPLSPTSEATRIEAFRQGLRDLGYIEGKNILVEYRYAEGKSDRIPALVGELFQLKVDILVAEGLSATRAAKQADQDNPHCYSHFCGSGRDWDS